jgi:hypothetical protein
VNGNVRLADCAIDRAPAADQILDDPDLLDLVAAAVNPIVAVAVLSARPGGASGARYGQPASTAAR